jgi:hypothetical protein
MKRITGFVAGIGALALAAGIALAEDTATPQGGAAAGTEQQPAPSAQPAAPAAPDAATQPVTPADPSAQPATPATPDAAATAPDVLARIREQGKSIDAKADKKVTTALEAAVNDVEKSVTIDGDRKIAERLAGEFGTTPDALISEKNDFKTSWGQLMIAHSLTANSSDGLTTKQLFDLRGEGMSWAQIASGMGLRLGEVVNAAKAEAKVARGIAKPDGKVAVVRMATAPSAKAAPAAGGSTNGGTESK